MQSILLTAAHTTPYLPELVEELRAIENVLRPLEERQLWKVLSNRAASLTDIFDAFARMQNQIQIFHYSGHANQTELFFEGGGNIHGIAGMMGIAKNAENEANPLRFVFLNGCASKGQVAHLHQAGIAAVVATLRPIGDEAASNFAKQFYKTWALEGKTLEQAFLFAKNYLLGQQSGGQERRIDLRGLALLEEDNEVTSFDWSLYINPNTKVDIQNFQLNPVVQLPPQILKNVPTFATEAVLNLVAEFEKKDSEAQKVIEEGTDPLLALITRLPWTIGTHLRRLFALEPSQSMYKPGLERLRELVFAYHELTRFICYLSLSTLWDEIQHSGINLESPLPLIPVEPLETVDYIWRLKQYLTLQQKIPGDPYVIESHLQTFLDAAEGELHSGYLFMEELKIAFDSESDPERINELVLSRTGKIDGLTEVCLQAEAVYTQFLKASLWLTEFRLYTVRSILVDKARYVELENPFVHRTINLHGAFSDIKMISTRRKIASDNACILFAPRQNSSSDPLANALNLSPFYIDKSAFIEDNTTYHPSIYVLTHQNDKGEFLYEYLDGDINHQYRFKEDQSFRVLSVGAVFPKALNVKLEDSRKFRVIYQQLSKLTEDFSPK